MPLITSTGQYTRFGLIKYSLSLAGAGLGVVAAYMLGSHYIVAIVLGFYLVEIHMLFLFPVLLDGIPAPLSASMRLTYRVGIVTCLLTVLLLAGYMLLGLLRFDRPLKNWYIGCLAVLLWYVEETAVS